jgi:hypothetical protein
MIQKSEFREFSILKSLGRLLQILGAAHDPAKLFHPSRTTKQFSGWDEVIFPSLRKEPETDTCYQ